MLWLRIDLKFRLFANTLFCKFYIKKTINSNISLNLEALKILALKTSLVAQTVKRLPTMRETWVQPLGREDPLEK